jgi:hypothetical protein
MGYSERWVASSARGERVTTRDEIANTNHGN